MSAPNHTVRDGEARDDLAAPATASAGQAASPSAGPAFDWQVLLLRYLPQPVGSTHVIKRLAPR
jgi:hypothetical protein